MPILYKRPNTYAEAILYLQRANDASVGAEGEREQLRAAIDRLFALNWFERGLRPLYENNTLVQFLVNTLVPTVVELLSESEKLGDAIGRIPSEKRTALQQRFRGVSERLRRACRESRAREVTERFTEMREAMDQLSTDEVVLGGLEHLYVALRTARAVLDLFLERLYEALTNHDDVMSSTHVPLRALALQ